MLELSLEVLRPCSWSVTICDLDVAYNEVANWRSHRGR
jgi:hypothetical protein